MTSKAPHVEVTSGRFGGVRITASEMSLREADLARAFIERWAMVVAVPDGEDSAGRQKLRMLTTDELVAKACDVAETFSREIERRGWLVELPPPPKDDAP